MTNKTTITLEIPKDQRLGQALMNAFRKQWQPQPISLDALKNNWDGMTQKGKSDYRDIQEYIDSRMQKEYWDIWEKDVAEIQRAINEMNDAK